MILPTTLLLGALGYLFYNSKKELSIKDTIPKYKFDLLFDANSIDLS